MAITRLDFIRSVRDILREGLTDQDEGRELDLEDIYNAIETAAMYHSRYLPQEVVKDIAGAGSYDIEVPTDWLEGVSAIKSLEYPQGNRDPDYLEPKDYMMYRSPTKTYIRFLDATPAVGKTVRLFYTTPHSISDTVSTISTNDFWALSNLAAYFAAGWLAAKYTRSIDPTLDADTVDYSQRVDMWVGIAQKCYAIWQSHMNFPTDRQGPQGGFGDLDLQASDAGRRFLAHGGSTR